VHQSYKIQGKAIHDANIVATMLAYNIRLLVTYNTSDFRRFCEIVLEPIKPEVQNEKDKTDNFGAVNIIYRYACLHRFSGMRLRTCSCGWFPVASWSKGAGVYTKKP
jgi:hypothetical protein